MKPIISLFNLLPITLRLREHDYKTMRGSALIVLGIVSIVGTTPYCEPDLEECEVYLVVDSKLTMMNGKEPVIPQGTKLYQRTETNVSQTGPAQNANVISADGWKKPRLVFVFNGTLPGPPIEVWENQTVKIHVRNQLYNRGVTVHWHGLHQRGTPFMDGVAFVSQCPVLPGQTFTYVFHASSPGTFWYHAQLGNQRAMGLYGPFIIHEKTPKFSVFRDFIWTVSEWNHELNSDLTYHRMKHGLYEGSIEQNKTNSPYNAQYRVPKFHSGLLNGRGRYYDPDTGEHNGAPLSTFTVTPGHTYRIRVIAAGELYPFRISVDQHFLTVIASDGYYLEPVTAESFIINPGERFDFLLNATQAVDNYWIRGETLEEEQNYTVEAILLYEGASVDQDPSSQKRNCSQQAKCVMVNCPSPYYLPNENISCLTFGHLRADSVQDTPENRNTNNFGEHFLNFAFPGNAVSPGNVNGKSLKFPSVAAAAQPQEIMKDCSPSSCDKNGVCKCTWSLDLNNGSTHQFVLTNLRNAKGLTLPIHMHGHSFYVVKMGYGRYNETTGEMIGDNVDISCVEKLDVRQTFCYNFTWSDPSWHHGNVPGLQLEKPPRKDTLTIPPGGYAVVRMKANNPGIWMIHCQIQLYNMDGMAVLLNESYSHVHPRPDNFPTCRSYFGSNSLSISSDRTTPGNTLVPVPKLHGWVGSTDYSRQLFWGVVGCLLGIIGILLFLLILYMCLFRNSSHRLQAYTLEPAESSKYAFQNKGAQL